MLLVGSTNWTKASRSNHEINLLVRLNEEGLQRYAVQTQKVLQHSRGMLEADCKVGQAVRVNRRARSAEPKTKLKEESFAKRHSVMIARKAKQAALEHRLAFGPDEPPAVGREDAGGHVEDYTSEPDIYELMNASRQ